ncbi:MAG: class I SAM-dependent methyltransferase [Luteibaculaceae bacterium]
MHQLPPSDWFIHWFNTSYYHTLYQHRNLVEAKTFIELLAEHLNLPKGSQVIDIACGKGRHSLTLNQLGYRVTGLDISEESIKEANKSANEHLKFIQQDMRDPFNLENQDAAFNFFTSFGYFNSDMEHLTVLNNVKKALKPQGIFVLDYLNANLVIKNLVKEEVKTLDDIQFTINRYLLNNKIVKRIEVKENSENHVFFEQVSALTLQHFSTLLERAGFSIVETFGNYRLGFFHEEESERLIILAKAN